MSVPVGSVRWKNASDVRDSAFTRSPSARDERATRRLPSEPSKRRKTDAPRTPISVLECGQIPHKDYSTRGLTQQGTRKRAAVGRNASDQRSGGCRTAFSDVQEESARRQGGTGPIIKPAGLGIGDRAGTVIIN